MINIAKKKQNTKDQNTKESQQYKINNKPLSNREKEFQFTKKNTKKTPQKPH